MREPAVEFQQYRDVGVADYLCMGDDQIEYGLGISR